jgi:N-acetylglucosaminyldiphosphoundecaprenol N-acetyl-beta-D-mannosaminyltransferase
MNRITLLNVIIDNLTLSELLDRLRNGGIVFTTNVDHLMKLQRYEAFFQAYQDADYCVCDSQILMFFSKFLGRPIREKISGSDLLPAFYEHYQTDPSMTLFLLGAQAGVAATAQDRINRKVNRPIVVGEYSPPWGFETDEAAGRTIVDRVNQSQATVLAIGVGSPKQEQWIVQYRHQMPHVKVILAIGASIDFEAGTQPRSPQWMSLAGLEWLYRLLHEPQRLWPRYAGDALPFLGLMLKQRFNRYQNPWAVASPDSNLAPSEELTPF